MVVKCLLPHYRHRSCYGCKAVLQVNDIIVSGHRQGLSVVGAIPRCGITGRVEYSLPIAVEYFNGTTRIISQVPDEPGIIDAVTVG